MSREVDEARRLLARRLQQAAYGTFYGTVEEVDEKTRTCDVRVGRIVYKGVLLYALEDGSLKGAVVIPGRDSGVLVSRIAGGNRFYVSMFSVIDKITVTIGEKQIATFCANGFEIKTDQSALGVTSEGLILKRGGAGLKKTLGDLCDALARLTVTTGVGPSGTPINKMDFQRIKQELNDYLED